MSVGACNLPCLGYFERHLEKSFACSTTLTNRKIWDKFVLLSKIDKLFEFCKKSSYFLTEVLPKIDALFEFFPTGLG